MSSSKPNNPLGKSCQICGAALAPGELKYILKVEIWADFDGHLPEKDNPAEMDQVLKEMEQTDPEVLESQVHHIQYYLICPTCRKSILRHPSRGDDQDESPLFSLH